MPKRETAQKRSSNGYIDTGFKNLSCSSCLIRSI